MTSIACSKAFKIEEIPIEQAFHLFSPEGEKEWVLGWNYQNLMGTTELCEDYIFTTKTHDHTATKALWIVKHYDPGNYVIELYRVEPEEKIGVIRVTCSDSGQETTDVTVTYRCVALSTTGEQFINSFTKDHYNDFITEWQSLLQEYQKNKS
ncbi:MAG: hypothetical protein GKR87_00625 [Kiritimatiellae bacterium]|nr:hypothetical protein [Kiritimatiellia bacterium]